MDYTRLIGQYYGEPGLGAWLGQMGIANVPRLKRGEDTAYLSDKSLGIELTFEDSESLEEPDREYPDGALVLVNIRFYGVSAEGFSAFRGELPLGAKFGITRTELEAQFGRPNWANPSGKKLSWENESYWFQVNLDDQDRVEIVSLQRPM